MTEFTKEDVVLLKALVDALVSATELEPDEQRAINKLYSFLAEIEDE